MAVTKLTISPCKVDSGKISVDTSKKKFEVMINPSDYTHGFTIQYNKDEALGATGSEQKFDAYKPEKISFDLVIDGTGVVAGTSAVDVKTRMKDLEGTVYKFDGNAHEPQYVRLLWGSLLFYGRLETLSVQYTLFKPSGEPLRAAVKLSFIEFVSKEEEALEANKTSPDLTHIVEVKAGDTLPLLCARIYKDSSYYIDVARWNNLVNFRDIEPGSRLHFPPLKVTHG
ncbi:MAG: peptidoglycan-binding protein [Nitrospirales bacterium]|nr:peptidoglycan-binding protein [Nitrospirales bacterium]